MAVFGCGASSRKCQSNAASNSGVFCGWSAVALQLLCVAALVVMVAGDEGGAAKDHMSAISAPSWITESLNDNKCTGVQKKGKWDFLMLVLVWPQTACRILEDQCALSRISDRFAIRGLWPMYNDGTWPVYCTDKKFDISKLTDLDADLEKFWPDMVGNMITDWSLAFTGPHLWREQWDTHGTCLSKEVHNYFSQTITLRKLFKLESYMWASGIHPSSNFAFHAGDIQRAFAYGFGGKQPQLTCWPPRSSPNDDSETQLHEVRICVDKDRKVIDCPESVHKCAAATGSTCDGRLVRIPVSEMSKLEASAKGPYSPSGGFVFVLYFALFFFFYVVGGCVYNWRERGVTGLDAMPNKEFWRKAPTYIKDGCLFAWGHIVDCVAWVKETYDKRKADEEEKRNIFT